MQFIKCKTCFIEKTIEEFAKCKDCKNGIRGDCKKCHSKKSVLYQQENAEKRSEYNKKWHIENKDKVKKSQDLYKEIKNSKRRDRYANDKHFREAQKKQAKEWQSNNPNKRKSQRLKKYGLTFDEYMNMLNSCNSSCMICGYSDMSNKKMFPVIDHCHDSEKVRGILCSKCNIGLGNFNDSIDNLEKAIKYIKDNN